ncbi:MAG: His/Gly/Thr/Pro-type tRNA ligase C-terminal domain-containing protein [Verrucomicrobiota bacterium]
MMEANPLEAVAFVFRSSATNDKQNKPRGKRIRKRLPIITIEQSRKLSSWQEACDYLSATLDPHERFIGFLIEHYAGNFPLWLAPEQVRVMTLNADDNLIAYAKDIAQQLRAAEVRVTSDLGPEPIKAKIAEAGTAKAHTVW